MNLSNHNNSFLSGQESNSKEFCCCMMAEVAKNGNNAQAMFYLHSTSKTSIKVYLYMNELCLKSDRNSV